MEPWHTPVGASKLTRPEDWKPGGAAQGGQKGKGSIQLALKCYRELTKGSEAILKWWLVGVFDWGEKWPRDGGIDHLELGF